MGLFKNVKGMHEQLQQAQQAQQSADQAAASQSAGPVNQMMGNMGDQAAYAQLAQKLNQTGVEAQGVVHAIRGTGQTDISGGQMTHFDVSIKGADGEPFQTTIEQSMLPAQLEGIAEGQAITVKYDPDSPTSAMIFGW